MKIRQNLKGLPTRYRLALIAKWNSYRSRLADSGKRQEGTVMEELGKALLDRQTMSDVSRGPAQKKTLQLCIYNDICYKIIKSQIIFSAWI